MCFQQVGDATDGEPALRQPAAAAAATFTDTTKSRHEAEAEQLERQATTEVSASGLPVGEHAGRSDSEKHGTQATEPPAAAAVSREGAPMETAPRARNASGVKTALKQVAAKAPPVVYPLPMTREEAVQAAVEGIVRAWAAGVCVLLSCSNSLGCCLQSLLTSA